MKNLLKGILLGVLLITAISAVTMYRIRDIQGDKPGNKTLWEELRDRYTKAQADTTFVKVADLVTPTEFDTLNITAKATAPTMPVGTNTTDVATMAALQAQIAATQYVFTVAFDASSISSPNDATTYYMGVAFNNNTTAGAANRQLTLPFNCTLIGYSAIINAATAGTTETYSIYVRKNNTTDDSLGSSFQASTVNGFSKYFSASNLNYSYSAGDKIEIKIVTPTWATNPATLIHNFLLFFKMGNV